MIALDEPDLLAPRRRRSAPLSAGTAACARPKGVELHRARFLRPLLELRIDDERVHARLRRWGREDRLAEAPTLSGTLADAVAGAVGSVLPGRRVVNPRLRVILSGSEPRGAVLRLDALPRRRADRDLVIVQRFCREYRLDPSEIAVAHAIHTSAARGAAGVIEFAPRAYVEAIRAGCAAHGLHCDEIVSELSVVHRAMAARRGSEAGLVLVLAARRTTFLLLDTDGLPRSVAALAEASSSPAAQARLLSRVSRYAAILGVGFSRFPLLVAHERGTSERFLDQLRGLGCPMDTLDLSLLRGEA